MPGTNEFLLTNEGKEQYEKEYRRLLDVERPEVIEQLQAARAMGDLSENADYDAARNRQAQIEARISEIEYILNNYRLVESSESKRKGKTINISNVVTYKEFESGETYTVKVVSSVESDPVTDVNNIKVSNECALGKALIGRKIGDIVRVNGIKPYDIEIVEFK